MPDATDQMTRARLVCPFDLTVEPLDRMLNFEITDDPHYTGLEIQWLDDPDHGTGMVVLVTRRGEGRTDVYRQPGLRLDPATYAIAGGLGRWEETIFEPSRLEITDRGVLTDVRFRDADGREIEVHVDDRGGRTRRPADMLAPLGAAVEHPASLMLVWMRLDLVRRRGREPEIRIDGRPAAIGQLPGAWLHRRRLIKLATDLAVVRLNPDGSPSTIDPSVPGVETARDGTAIAALFRHAGAHHARLELDPSLPDLRRIPDGRKLEGTWHIGIDTEASVVGGTWTARRSGTRVDLALDVTRGWRPRGLPPLMRIVTRVLSVFRTWPTTYRWTAAVELGGEPTMTARWERTGDQRAQSYERLTG